MEVPLRVKWIHEGHHRDAIASVSPFSLHSIRKLSVGKTLKIDFFTNERTLFKIVVYKVIQVLGGLRMEET